MRDEERSIDWTISLDAETKASERPGDHRTELRLWLRMLTCTSLIESEIRRRLRSRFGITLPRFDLMAQLEKAPQGLTLGEISRRMMVSNGNVTGLVERLAVEGLVERRASSRDRRATYVRLTVQGRAAFDEMACVHREWMAELFGELDAVDVGDLMALLAKTKGSVQRAILETDS